jgi:hypothetical protein
MAHKTQEEVDNIIGISEEEISNIANKILEAGLFPVWHPAPPPKRKRIDEVANSPSQI